MPTRRQTTSIKTVDAAHTIHDRTQSTYQAPYSTNHTYTEHAFYLAPPFLTA